MDLIGDGISQKYDKNLSEYMLNLLSFTLLETLEGFFCKGLSFEIIMRHLL